MRGVVGCRRAYLTRICFPDDPALAKEPILKLVRADRTATLIAGAVAPATVEWDISMQGANETVLFDF